MQTTEEIIKKEIDYIYRVKFNLTVSEDLMKDIKRLIELELLLAKLYKYE